MMNKRIVAIVGSYRRGGTVDRLVDQVLESAAENGAHVEKVFLLDYKIEFCTNCRSCTQTPGEQRGECQLVDDMEAILEMIQRADAVVLGAPVNFDTVTAVMKRFIERTICRAYWPWGALVPKKRERHLNKRAVIVSSSAAPALLTRLATCSISVMRKAAGLLGAKPVGTLVVGIAAMQSHRDLPAAAVRKARRLGRKLAVAPSPQ